MNIRIALLTCLSLCALLALAVLLGSGSPTVQADAPPRATPAVAPGAPSQAQWEAQHPTQSAYPDLTIQSITVEPSPALVNRTVTIKITIVNNSDTYLTYANNFLVDLYIDPAQPPEAGRPGEPGTVTFGVQWFYVPPREPYTISYSTVFTDVGGHSLWAQIDTDGSVVESNEYNNIFGPVQFEVTTSRRFKIDTHEEFQSGFSNLDLSSPYGVIQSYTRWFREPDLPYSPTLPSFYDPDNRLNPRTYTPIGGGAPVTDTANQIRPKLAVGPNQELFAVWEDGRNGEVYNRDIYFASSSDFGKTWSDAIRINQDPITRTANQLYPTITYDADGGGVFVFWQDNRLGRGYDIWYSYSCYDAVNGSLSAWQEAPRPVNDDYQSRPTADQMRPTVTIERLGTKTRDDPSDDISRVYLAWQDRRNGNDDIYFSVGDLRQEPCSTRAGYLPNDFLKSNVFVTDDPRITQQSQTAPNIAASDDKVFLTWQDTRNSPGGDPSDIYYTFGEPTPPITTGLPTYTFQVDRLVNDDEEGNAPQYSPSVGADEYLIVIPQDVLLPGSSDPAECHPIYTATIAIMAWQDWRIDEDDDENTTPEPDIYKTHIIVDAIWTGRLDEVNYDDPPACYTSYAVEVYERPIPQGYVEENQKVSNASTFIPLDPFDNNNRLECLAYDAPAPSASEPSWQGEPAVWASDRGVFIAWTDSRVFDDSNFDIFLAETYADPVTDLMDLFSWHVATVQNNLHRQAFIRDGRLFLENKPAAARQNNPAIAALDAATLSDTLGFPVYYPVAFVAWDDNRNDVPFTGYSANRDAFVAQRTFIGSNSPITDNLEVDPGRGIYISPIFDAGGEATWYDIEWWGVTQLRADILLQTRFGTTPTPPLSDEPANGWTTWTGIGGARGFYDAPGQHIRGPDGNVFPRYRYAQFRVLLSENAPLVQPGAACVSEITMNYEGGAPNVYIPVILKEGSPTIVTRVPNDPLFARFQWNMQQVKAPRAWTVSLGSGQRVAVIDSGLDVGHPEFSDKLVAGRDFVQNDDNPQDEHGHGTHITGIIAARPNNNTGIAGLGWDAKARPVRALNFLAEGTIANVAAAIRWSVDQGDRIINLSLSGPVDSGTLRDAVAYAQDRGALLVASVGDDKLTGNQTPYPAAIDGVIGVGATTNETRRARTSNTGPWVDLAAPGGEPTSSSDSVIEHWIWSTWPRNTGVGIPAIGYNRDSGTGQAAAHVSAAAALVWAVNPGLTGDQVAFILQQSAYDLGEAGPDPEFGNGLLDAYSAVLRAQATTKRTVAFPDGPRLAPNRELQPQATRSRHVAGELIVALHAEAAKDGAAVAARWGLKVSHQLTDASYLLTVPEGLEELLAREVASDPRVRYAEPNYILTGD